jgi:hypothetical protein
MVENDSFTFTWSRRSESETTEQRLICDMIYQEALPAVSAEYAKPVTTSSSPYPSGLPASIAKLLGGQSKYFRSPVKSWKRSLAALGPDLEKLLTLRHELTNLPCLVLEMTPESSLWTAACQIKG